MKPTNTQDSLCAVEASMLNVVMPIELHILDEAAAIQVSGGVVLALDSNPYG